MRCPSKWHICAVKKRERSQDNSYLLDLCLLDTLYVPENLSYMSTSIPTNTKASLTLNPPSWYNKPSEKPLKHALEDYECFITALQPGSCHRLQVARCKIPNFFPLFFFCVMNIFETAIHNDLI